MQVDQGPEPARWQRRLLPGSMVDGPGARRSLRDWVVDVLVTVVALGVGVVALHSSWADAVGRGLSNADISAELHLSVATVKAHVSRLLEKLGADNRVQVALLIRDASPPDVRR